ncbi:MAG: mRNA surveillance protein pelota [Nanoarchaeota archaeon]
MQIVHKDLKHGEVKVRIESADDLWYLSQVIMPADLVKGSTIRKIKIGGGEERSAQIIKKRVFLAVMAEKVEFTGQSLRVLGQISEGTDDIPKGSYHSFGLEEGDIITIVKEEWLRVQLEKLDEACQQRGGKVLILVFDRESAIFGMLKRSGYEILTSLEGDVEKKAMEQHAKGFYDELWKMLEAYNQRFKPEHIILASPGFWKEEFLKVIGKTELPIVQATVSSATENAFSELLKRDELKAVLEDERIAQDTKMVEALFSEIAKDAKASYGLSQVKMAAEAGAVEMLLLTDGLLLKSRDDGKDKELDWLMRQVERCRGRVHIIYSEHEPGRKLDGLGGIAAMLRYKI